MEKQIEKRRDFEIRTPIRITVPAKVAYNLDVFKESMLNIAERLGCPKCFSGRNCYFQMERDYVLDINGKVSDDLLRPIPQDPVPLKKASINVASKANYDIEGLLRITEEIVVRLGHDSCISGFDFSFEQLVNPVINPSKLFDVNNNLKVNEFKFSV